MLKHLAVFSILWYLTATRPIAVINVTKQSAEVGGMVTLQCQLQADLVNVFQVTWQKETGNFSGPVSTCSRVYGQRLLGYAANRTRQLTIDTLNVSSITISPVVQEDQGCFKCIFNVYPLGASSGRICLDVYEAKIPKGYKGTDHQTDADLSIINFTEQKVLPEQGEVASHVLYLLAAVILAVLAIFLIVEASRRNCLVLFIVKKTLFSISFNQPNNSTNRNRTGYETCTDVVSQERTDP